MTAPTFDRAPGLDDLAAIAEEALGMLPEELARHCRDVVVRIEELCDEETEDEMELESPFELLGLYTGNALPYRGAGDVRQDVDMIVLYRLPIVLEWCESGESLARVVRHVLIHEIGHHFGFSDADMTRLEREN